MAAQDTSAAPPSPFEQNQILRPSRIDIVYENLYPLPSVFPTTTSTILTTVRFIEHPLSRDVLLNAASTDTRSPDEIITFTTLHSPGETPASTPPPPYNEIIYIDEEADNASSNGNGHSSKVEPWKVSVPVVLVLIAISVAVWWVVRTRKKNWEKKSKEQNERDVEEASRGGRIWDTPAQGPEDCVMINVPLN